MSEQLPDHFDADRRRVLAAAAGATVAAFAGPSFAQSFPTHTIRMVVPFPAGGPTDMVARPIAAMLSEALGQQVVVDNKGGAGGSIGADIVAKAPPDGYTVLMGTVGTHAINPSLYRKLPYDPVADFSALGLVASAPVAIVVHPSAPYKTVGELIAAAKREPGSIYFGSAGNGTPGHLTGEMFAKAAGVQFKHVPYKGSAPALNDLLGGQIPLMFDPVQSVLQHVRAGKLRALAVSSSKRSPVLKETVTVAEAGLKDFEATAWWALFAPAGLPPEISAKLAKEIQRIVVSDAFGKHLIELGVDPAAGGNKGFAEFQKAEIEKWGRAVRESGVSLG